jgi:hypothetical protein
MRALLPPSALGFALAAAARLAAGGVGQPPAIGAGASAEARAVAYLSAEVPRWRREHPCYSCHNNGDATRALIEAGRRGFDVGPAIDDTLAWLSRPGEWDANATTGGFDDKVLAHVQFASALTAAGDRLAGAADAARAAAQLLARDQAADGSWRLDASESVGSPVTYGRTLATAAAIRSLEAAAVPELAGSIARGRAWLRAQETQNVLDSSAVILGLAGDAGAGAAARRARARALLAGAQAPDGGWGLYTTSASEPFDTALAMLALLSLPGDADAQAAIARGRAFLIDGQLADGSWPETTRPAGQESYAQRISTTAWATLALLLTDPPGTGR